jgi:lipopolysaccharide export LptBFGC system permease protein LptF
VEYYSIFALGWICDVLPLLVLVSGVLCVWALVRNNEHLIYKSSGVPLQRAFRPIIWLTLLISLGVAVLRETAMPALIMERDYLRPLVYRRTPAPTALAMPTIDAEGHAVLFHMSQYNSNQREGRNLRVYQMSDTARMPMILADRVTWEGAAWRLETEPPQTLQVKGHPAGAKAEAKTLAKPKLIPHGYQITPAEQPAADLGTDPARTNKKPIAEWRGAVTPAFLEYRRLGAGVMALSDLSEASRVKPELRVEWWQRLGQALMGVFLLWLAIPLLVSDVRSPLWGAGLSILVAAAYQAASMGFAEGARRDMLPACAPLLVAGIFCVAGYVRFHRRMAT